MQFEEEYMSPSKWIILDSKIFGIEVSRLWTKARHCYYNIIYKIYSPPLFETGGRGTRKKMSAIPSKKIHHVSQLSRIQILFIINYHRRIKRERFFERGWKKRQFKLSTY